MYEFTSIRLLSGEQSLQRTDGAELHIALPESWHDAGVLVADVFECSSRGTANTTFFATYALGWFLQTAGPPLALSGAWLLFAEYFAAAHIPLIYSFYIWLRWVVTGSALYAFVESYQRRRQFGALFAFAVAILFNPIEPVTMNIEVWRWVDLGVGLALLAWAFGYHVGKEELRKKRKLE